MRASLVIASRNEGPALAKTVGACLDSAEGLDCEVVVADDASDDSSLEEVRARFPEVRIVSHAERRGVSMTKDLGARGASGEVLVFLDGHCKPEPGSIGRLIADVEDLNGMAIVTPSVAALDVDAWANDLDQVGHGFRIDLETFEVSWVDPDALRPYLHLRRRSLYAQPTLCGCVAAMSRRLYESLWGFDTGMRTYGSEDVDLGVRAWLMGYKVLHDEEPVVGHRFRNGDVEGLAPGDHLLANQFRMARKLFTDANWFDWLERQSARHHAAAWQSAWSSFLDSYESVERERAHLLAHRRHDEFWYASEFGLSWPSPARAGTRPTGAGPARLLGDGGAGDLPADPAVPSPEQIERIRSFEMHSVPSCEAPLGRGTLAPPHGSTKDMTAGRWADSASTFGIPAGHTLAPKRKDVGEAGPQSAPSPTGWQAPPVPERSTAHSEDGLVFLGAGSVSGAAGGLPTSALRDVPQSTGGQATSGTQTTRSSNPHLLEVVQGDRSKPRDDPGEGAPSPRPLDPPPTGGDPSRTPKRNGHRRGSPAASKAKVLVAIANYGPFRGEYVDLLIANYGAMGYDVDIVVFSDTPKPLRDGARLVVGLPGRHPWTLPFAHKPLFAEEVDHYDLFIYTEDDIVISEGTVDAFREAADLLEDDEVPGLFRYERGPDGRMLFVDAHPPYDWVAGSVRRSGPFAFASFTNDHSGCYILSRAHLARALRSGGYLVGPHRSHYELRESAATDPYTRCGLARRLCISHLDRFLVRHLVPNTAGIVGMEEPAFRSRIAGLLDGLGWSGSQEKRRDMAAV